MKMTKMTTMKVVSRDESAVPAMVSTMAKGPHAGSGTSTATGGWFS
jgi:hypothetical protein